MAPSFSEQPSLQSFLDPIRMLLVCPLQKHYNSSPSSRASLGRIGRNNMETLPSKADRLHKIREEIADYCKRAGRNTSDVTLLAVSKTKSEAEIRDFAALGLKSFGENYVQEAIGKVEKLKDLQLDWHFIGALQTNKAKFIPGNFSLIHSVDSFALATKLNAQAEKRASPLRALVEVNLHLEVAKGGLLVRDLPDFFEKASELKSIQFTGLMCIPDPEEQAKDPRRAFASLRECLQNLNARGVYAPMKELSMGMSADFGAAILEGSTIVRIGSSLFGARH